MLVRISAPELVPDLLDYLRSGIDVVADQVDDDEVLVGILGSRSQPSQQLELATRLASWWREHPKADVLLLAEAA